MRCTDGVGPHVREANRQGWVTSRVAAGGAAHAVHQRGGAARAAH